MGSARPPYTEVRFRGDEEEVSRQWREARLGGVGGSDVAAIMGISAYSTPLGVWLEKTGRVEAPDLSASQAVEWGNRLEPVVGAKFAESHPELRVARKNAMLVSRERPWAFANLDYSCLHVAADGARSRYVLECKTAGLGRSRDWEDGVPDYYLTQVTHYLGVTGYAGAWVAVLIGGQDYREYFVPRDEEDVEAVARAVDVFWRDYVEADVMPEVAGADAGNLSVVFPEASDEVLHLLDEDAPDVARLAELKGEAARVEAERREVEARLKAHIGAARGIETPSWRVTWPRSSRERVTCDWRRFDAEHPHLLDGYVTKETKTWDGGLRLTARKGA